MRIFISGGCKNGKSTYAQDLIKTMRDKEEESCRIADVGWGGAVLPPLYYIATMEPTDKEDDDRIKRHIEERHGMGFQTVELARDIARLDELCDLKGFFLLDSLTALLANEMFGTKSKAEMNQKANEKVKSDLAKILSKIENIVIVSDYIYSEAESIGYDDFTENYRKGLAELDRYCAKECQIVLEACYGNLIAHKGENLIKNIKGGGKT